MVHKAAFSTLALIALAGTTAGAQVIDWLSPVDGNWSNSANWMGGNVPDTASEHAVLGLTGPYTVNLDISSTVGSLLISNPLVTLELPGSRSITLNGPLTNNGTVLLNSNQTNNPSAIIYAVDTIIDGNGVIDMYRTPGAQWGGRLTANPGVTATIGANQIVQGSGHIYGGTSGVFVNNGLVTATDPLAKLDLEGTFIGGTGVYMADGGTLNLAMINGSNTPSTFTNVTFDTANGGQIIPEGSNGSSNRAPRFDGVTNLGTLSIPNGFVIRLDGPLTNNGTVLADSLLSIQNSTTIDGVGTINLGGPNSRIHARTDVIATFGPGQTIQGAGVIVTSSGTGSIVNNGIINATNPNAPLTLSGTFTGNGQFRADVGTLQLNSSTLSNSTIRADGGIVDLAGSSLTDITIDQTGMGLITISSAMSEFDRVTNVATLELPDARTITLNGPLTNNGTVLLNPSNWSSIAMLSFNTDTFIDGSGAVEMLSPGGLDGGRIQTNSFTATIGANQTVRGSGQLNGTFINNGIVNATDPLSRIYLVGTFIGGTGVYRADGGTMVLSDGSTFIDVTFDTNGGEIHSTPTGPFFDGVVNAGTLSIRNREAINLSGPLINNGTVLVNSNGGTNDASSLYFQNSTTIDGIGTIELNATTAIALTSIQTAPDVIATFGPGQTIQGAGSIASASTGSIVNNGTILPGGDLREISLTGNITLTPTSHLIFDLGGPNIGEYDRMPITGSASNIALDGTLTVNIDDGYEPVFGDLWELIDGGNHTGEFAQVNSPNAPFGLIFKAVYEGDRMYVVLSCEADLNSDGAIDFFDVSAFLAAYSSGDLMADFTGDGQLNFFDVSAFLQVFSAGCP